MQRTPDNTRPARLRPGQDDHQTTPTPTPPDVKRAGRERQGDTGAKPGRHAAETNDEDVD